ncbi:hypothetical protein NHQ30_003421 [Ciborinia camelliae]|nr:hypothetical protein NHQ30_003421 [Ciborinia camelliae]
MGGPRPQEIQEATASEPLSLEEEYQMQKSWRMDRDKLTFILCLPDEDEDEHDASASESSSSGRKSGEISKGVHDREDQMVGDINLFLSDADVDVDEGEEKKGEEKYIGEIEIMIAKPSARGKGLGRAAVLTFMEFLRGNWEGILREYRGGDGNRNLFSENENENPASKNENGITKETKEENENGITKKATENDAKNTNPNKLQLRVKIGGKNISSIRLFESIGFVKVGEGENYFGEVELVFGGWHEEGLMRRFGVKGYRECVYR